MPKGSPNKNTIRVERYKKKAGYKTKTFSLKSGLTDAFAEACKRAGVSQASVIARAMREFIDSGEDASK